MLSNHLLVAGLLSNRPLAAGLLSNRRKPRSQRDNADSATCAASVVGAGDRATSRNTKLTTESLW